MKYRPLNEDRDEIRVLRILPSTTSPDREPGRHPIRSNDLSSIKFLNGLFQEVPQRSSADLAPTKDPIHITLEHVSLRDHRPEYDSFLQSPNENHWISYYLDNEHLFQPIPENIVAFDLPSWRFAYKHRKLNEFFGLKIVPRYTWGDYDALSYYWGHKNQDGEILIDGERTKVSKEVEAALRRLRALPETKYGMKYWIDALCIDQDNLKERNHQVKKMRDIYQGAFNVVVWLGEAADKSDQVIDFIATNFDQSEMEKDRFAQIATEELCKNLMALFNRPYWYRVWIIQELAMISDTIFLCGDRMICRPELMKTIDYCWNWIYHLREQLHKPLEGVNSSAATANSDPWLSIYRLDSLINLRVDNAKLDGVLAIARGSQSTDPKDNVYGILALLPSNFVDKITPDYEWTLKEVYLDFAKILLKQEGLEGLLAWNGQDGDLNLPSWVPDWRIPNNRNHLKQLRRGNANKELLFTVKADIRTLLLYCQGIKIDEISTMTEYSLSASDIGPYVKDNDHSEKTSGEEYPKVKDPTLLQAFCDTIVMEHLYRALGGQFLVTIPWFRYQGGWDDDFMHGEVSHWNEYWEVLEETPREYLQAFDKFRKENADFVVKDGHKIRDFFPEFWPPRKLPESMKTRIKANNEARRSYSLQHKDEGNPVNMNLGLAAVALVGRSLFTTSNGYLGLGPSSMRKGDIIAVLDCPFPVVLRLTKSGRYEYVGECYLNGYMAGEAAKSGLPIEEFVIQ